jgi:glycyl-tRNA synthetase beta chain
MQLFIKQKGISISVETSDAESRLYEFIDTRLGTYLSNMDIRYDISAAVVAVPHDDLFDAIGRIRCLNKEKDHESFEDLIIGQRRVHNILQSAKDKTSTVNDSLFDCDDEIRLWSEFEKTQQSFGAAMDEFNYKKALNILLSLRPHIDGFFDNCMVMDKDEKKRGNRLAMLKDIRALFNRYADFSLIVLKGEEQKESKQ